MIRARMLAVGVPVLSLMAYSPAAEASPPPEDRRVEWSPFRDRDGRPIDPDRLAEIIRISADVTTRSELRGWAVDVDAARGESYPGFGRVCEERLAAGAKTAHIDCDWDTTRRSGGMASANQGYVVRVSLDDGMEDAPGDGSRNVTVSNPASPPSQLRVRRMPKRGAVQLRWAPPPEPDVSRYVVGRRRDGAEWVLVAEPGRPEHDEDGLEPGRYVFRVGARRRNDSAGTPQRWAVSDPVVIPNNSPSAERDGASRPRRDRWSGRTAPAPGTSGSPEGNSGSAPEEDPGSAGDEGPGPAPGGGTGSAEDDGAGSATTTESRPGSVPADQGPRESPPPADHRAPEPPPSEPEISPLTPDAAVTAANDPVPDATWTLSPPWAGERAIVPAGRSSRSIPRRPAPAAPPDPRSTGAELPDGGDDGYALSLPYTPPPTQEQEASRGRERPAPALTPPPPAPAPGIDPPAADRRRRLASLALGQLCFVIAALARQLVHRASGHRWAPALARSVNHCPRCHARLTPAA